MIQVGIVIDNTKQLDGAKKIVDKIDKNKCDVVIFSNIPIAVEIACFPTSELVYFEGILISFNFKNLSQCIFAKQIKKLAWMPFVEQGEANDIINCMKVKKDERFMIIFDHSFSKSPDEDRKNIFSKTMLYPEKEIRQNEDLNNVIGELYENR